MDNIPSIRAENRSIFLENMRRNMMSISMWKLWILLKLQKRDGNGFFQGKFYPVFLNSRFKQIFWSFFLFSGPSRPIPTPRMPFLELAGHSSSLDYVTSKNLDSLKILNAICLHLLSQMFFANRVNSDQSMSYISVPAAQESSEGFCLPQQANYHGIFAHCETQNSKPSRSENVLL